MDLTDLCLLTLYFKVKVRYAFLRNAEQTLTAPYQLLSNIYGMFRRNQTSKVNYSESIPFSDLLELVLMLLSTSSL